MVTPDRQAWSVPPFEGRIADGMVWGRGALDMKGGVAMLLGGFLRANLQGLQPPGDVILALVSDEEYGSDFGARYLVEQHAEKFAGVHYALGEFGGFSLQIGKKVVYPIQIPEKQACVLKATVHGKGGHGSLPVRGGAMYKLGRLLEAYTQKRLPVHITPPARQMISSATTQPNHYLHAEQDAALRPGIVPHSSCLL